MHQQGGWTVLSFLISRTSVSQHSCTNQFTPRAFRGKKQPASRAARARCTVGPCISDGLQLGPGSSDSNMDVVPYSEARHTWSSFPHNCNSVGVLHHIPVLVDEGPIPRIHCICPLALLNHVLIAVCQFQIMMAMISMMHVSAGAHFSVLHGVPVQYSTCILHGRKTKFSYWMTLAQVHIFLCQVMFSKAERDFSTESGASTSMAFLQTTVSPT